MIYKNPEFKKNIKLEFSPTRILIPAFIFALVAWISWSVGTPKEWDTTPINYSKAESLTYGMFSFGFVFSIVWGSYLASNSLFGEMRQKTWDFMRMSSISPQKILFGKLFGSTFVVWVISLLGIIPTILIASTNLFIADSYHRPVFWTVASLISSTIFWMILSYSCVMLAGTYTSSRNSRHTTIGAVIGVLIAGSFIGQMMSLSYENEFELLDRCRYLATATDKTLCYARSPIIINGIHYSINDPQFFHWYNFKLFRLDAFTFIIIFSALWAVIGLYRTLRSSLQYKDSPYMWPIFLISSGFFLNGFGYSDRTVPEYITGISLFVAFSIVPVCIKEASHKIAYRQLYESLKAKEYKEAFRLTPLWAISLLCFICIAPFIFLCAGQLSEDQYTGKGEVNVQILPVQYCLFYASLILFAVRDIIAIHVISWHKSVRLPIVGVAVYFLLIYVLAPFIFDLLQGSTSSGMSYFTPLTPTSAHVNGPEKVNLMIFMLIHVSLMIALLIPFRKGLKTVLGK